MVIRRELDEFSIYSENGILYLKGNGFDGLQLVGSDDEVNRFISLVNILIQGNSVKSDIIDKITRIR